MLGYFVLGVLAAIGALSILWAALGWLLPSGQGCALVCWGVPDEGMRSRYHWLRAVGLFTGPLIAVTEQGTRFQSSETEICTPGELLSRLKWERDRFDGTGNGDPPGRNQRCGVSEL